MNTNLKGKVIVVSGGTKGVGSGTVLACAQAGAKVVIGGRDEGKAKEIIARIIENYGQEAIFVKTDLSQVSDCKKLIDTAVDTFGRIDGFVNYAGILPSASIVDTQEDLYDEVFTLNMKAAFFCAKYAVAAMLKSGGGSLVFVGSGHAYGGEEDRAVYSCSKGALLTLVRHLAKNYAKYKIRANWITMGWVATEGEISMREKQGQDKAWLEKSAEKFIPMGRLLTVEDHVPGILYFISDDSLMVTGTEMQITGGFTP